jgi:hypothetical protein
MRTHSIAGTALAWFAAVAITGCSDASDPTIVTNMFWIDPIMQPIVIQWSAPVDCAFGGSRVCLQDVPYTVDQIDCDGCVLGADEHFTAPTVPDGKRHLGGFRLLGIPRGVGPITVTVHVEGDHTLSATAMGDRVTGLRSECWTAPTGVFPPVGAPCGTTRSPNTDVYIVPIAQTINHGDFPIQPGGLDTSPQHGGGEPVQGIYFHPLEVTPASLRWGTVLTSPRTGATAIMLPSDTTTTSVSFRWTLVLGDDVTTTAAIPPLAL